MKCRNEPVWEIRHRSHPAPVSSWLDEVENLADLLLLKFHHALFIHMTEELQLLETGIQF